MSSHSVIILCCKLRKLTTTSSARGQLFTFLTAHPADSKQKMNNFKKYILWFAQEHLEFRRPEFESLVSLLGLKWRPVTEAFSEKPFWIIELENDKSAELLASRSISLRCILELWGHSNTVSGLHSNVKRFIDDGSESLQKYFSPDITFKIIVDTFNKHFSQKEKVGKIETFDYLPVKGEVNLKSPDVQWMYIEFWGLNPLDVPDKPYDLLFGRFIADGQRDLVKELSLKTRKFIGNTSMDPQLSLLMANQGKVKKGDFVFDPFVGTGSLLVSAAKFGGYVLGTDIDYMMLHAKCRPSRISQKVREKDESIKANLEQYGIGSQYIDVLVSDFSKLLWRDEIKFNSIITDPPYGIREAMERVEPKASTKPDTRTEGMPHYPSKSPYKLADIYVDLLNFSSKHLILGGRLVCWFPVHKDDYSENIIPRHTNLRLVSNSEQVLSAITSRRLLTYDKVSEPDENSRIENNEMFIDFRHRYFSSGKETRQERRIKRAELRVIGLQEALKRGKVIENGKVIKQ